jgi:hypothetical protein
VELACCEPVLVLPPPEGACRAPVLALPPLPELARCTAVLVRPLLLLVGGSCLARQLRDVWPESILASDFVVDFVPLRADEELGLSSSSRDLVVVEGLVGLAVSSRHLLSVGPRPCLPSICWLNIGRKKNASAGRGLAAVTANVRVANTPVTMPVERKRIGASNRGRAIYIT